MFCTALSSSVFGRFLACKCFDTPGLGQMPDVLDREKAAAEMFQLMPNGAFRSVALTYLSLSCRHADQHP
jgi:hypothetical protein